MSASVHRATSNFCYCSSAASTSIVLHLDVSPRTLIVSYGLMWSRLVVEKCAVNDINCITRTSTGDNWQFHLFNNLFQHTRQRSMSQTYYVASVGRFAHEIYCLFGQDIRVTACCVWWYCDQCKYTEMFSSLIEAYDYNFQGGIARRQISFSQWYIQEFRLYWRPAMSYSWYYVSRFSH